MKLETRPIGEIRPYPRNPRKITEEAVAKTAESLKRNGWQQPIVIDRDGVIIVGHTRRLAAQRLGMEEVPVTVYEGTAEDAQAYRIADNRTGEEAQWDWDLLAEDMGEISDDLEELAKLTAFDPDELARITEMGNDDETEGDDEAPEAPDEPESQRGEIYELGPHLLMCGDSTSTEDMQALVPEAIIDLVVTDPPYNVAYEGKTKDALTIENDEMDAEGKTKDALTIENDEMDAEAFRSFLHDAFAAANLVMKEGATFYVWHADLEGYNFRGACADAGWQVRQCLIWAKNTMVLGRQDYQRKHEPCLYGWKAGASHNWYSDRKQTTILDFDKPSRNAEHPTMKPVELIAYQIRNSSKSGDFVLDSFGGSGSTLIAAAKLNRKARLMELDPRYCDVIRKRWGTWARENGHEPGSGAL